MACVTTVKFDDKDREPLLELVRSVQQAERIVVLVGAGISTEAGIPDFRSKGGLYEQFGPNAFDSSIYRIPEQATEFLSSMVSLKAASDQATPTTTHRMIAALDTRGSLQRCYTQNIDGLESRLMQCFPPLDGITNGDIGANEDVKQWLPQHSAAFQDGTLHPCSCGWSNERPRQARSGALIPLITMNGCNECPYQDAIDATITADCGNPPDLVMVMGTSLRVDAFVELIRKFAVTASKVIFVNEKAAKSTTADLFTHHVQGRTDQWAELILGQPNETLSPTQSIGSTPEGPYLTSAHQTATEQGAPTDAELRSVIVSEILKGNPITPRLVGGVVVTKAILSSSPAEMWDRWLWGNEEERRAAWQYQEIQRMIVERTGSKY
ncbi:hypothetical protein FS837_008233 [Tulasnella sp. UAMH 9824]|nr:hypothetical protein FS837_008233 [Tulasnella sp. UAMH 9824]